MITGIVPSAYRRRRSVGRKTRRDGGAAISVVLHRAGFEPGAEQSVWPRLSEQDGCGPGKDPGQARTAQTRRMGMQNEKASHPKRRGRLRKLRRALALRVCGTLACGRDEAFRVVGFSSYHAG
jgi:hypothetical protein